MAASGLNRTTLAVTSTPIPSPDKPQSPKSKAQSLLNSVKDDVHFAGAVHAQCQRQLDVPCA